MAVPLFEEPDSEPKFRSICYRLLDLFDADKVPKPWNLGAHAPECSLADGRAGHVLKAKVLVSELKSCFYLWEDDAERDPIEDSEPFPHLDPDEEHDVGDYTGVEYDDVEGSDAEYADYPDPGVYELPDEFLNDFIDPEQVGDRDEEDFVLLEPPFHRTFLLLGEPFDEDSD